MDQRPNLILLMADQFRGDCLGFAGHPDVKTPYLDSLAAEGTWFPNAYSSCPTCVPARASLYTGMSQVRTGQELYFDLEHDPHETHNAIADPACAPRVDRLRRWLVKELAGREEGYSDGERLIVGRAPKTVLGAAGR